MSAGVLLGLGLAVLASVALNASYLLQHHDLAGAPAVSARHPLSTVRALFTSRVWLVGAVLGTVGWAMHVTALTRAPLSLVQAFFAGGLALAVPIAVVGAGHRVVRAELVGVGAMAAALAALAVGTGSDDAHGSFGAAALGAYLGVSAALAGVLALAPGPRRADALGLAGGVLYGASDVAIKALTGIGADHGLGGVLTSPWLLAAVLTNVTAFFCFQRGLQMGRALGVIALMTAGTNLVSIAGAFAVFGDPLGTSPALEAVHVAAFVLVGIAAWLLAPAQAAVTAGEEPSGARGEGAAGGDAAPTPPPAPPGAPGADGGPAPEPAPAPRGA